MPPRLPAPAPTPTPGTPARRLDRLLGLARGALAILAAAGMTLPQRSRAATPVVLELDDPTPSTLSAPARDGPVVRELRLLNVRHSYWPYPVIRDSEENQVLRSAEVDLEVSGVRTTLVARAYEPPRLVAGLRLYVETTRHWAQTGQLDPLPGLLGAVRLSAVAEGESWGPPTLRFPIRDYRWRANSYHNTWSSLVPYNKLYYHHGEDYGAIPDHLEVLASLAGRVSQSPLPEGARGSNRVRIESPDGWGIDYAHMNLESLVPTLLPGSATEAGEVLGRTGMTWDGRKSQHADPHLHWAVFHEGRPLASYPFAVDAYFRDYPDPVLANAGGYLYALPGEAVTLDATRSLARPGRRIVRHTWHLHDGRTIHSPLATLSADRPGLYSEELRVTADDGSEDRDFAQFRVWNPSQCERFAAGWFYHAPVRGARPGSPVTFWNRLWGTSSPVEIDFGDGSPVSRIQHAAIHAYPRAGTFTASLRSRGPDREPVTVRMRVVIEPPDGSR